MLQALAQREVQILVHRLRCAGGFMADAERAFDAGQRGTDLQRPEQRLGGTEVVRRHRGHDGVEGFLELGQHRLVDRRQAVGPAGDAQPPGRAQDRLAIGILRRPVRREHRRSGRRLAASVHLDTVVETRTADDIGHVRTAHQLRSRIGLSPKPQRWPDRRHWKADHHFRCILEVDLVEQRMHQRQIGAANARLHAGLRQPGLRIAPGGEILEHPELGLRAGKSGA